MVSPSILRTLSNIKVDDELKSAMESNKRLLRGYLTLEPTDTALLINGLYYDLEVTNDPSKISFLRIADITAVIAADKS